MKKIKNLLLVIVVMMFVSIMNVDAEGVSIKDIRLVDHGGSAVELSEPTTSGLSIKFDLSFVSVGDSVKYEVVLNNPTSTEYEINLDNKFNNSNYMEYNYEFKDKTNRLKANSESVLYITINYKNEVPVDSLVDGKYIENNTLGITLLNETNPNTFNNMLFVVLVILVLIGCTYLFIRFKNKELFIVILALMIVPVTVFALEKLKLTVETKITIGERYYVYYPAGVFIKTSELNDNDYIYENCSNEIKLEQEDGSYEDYSWCDRLLKKDPTPHFPGDRVSTTHKQFSYLESDLCTDNSESGYYICQKNALYIDDAELYYYYCTQEPGSNNCNNELNDLNFESISSDIDWNNFGIVGFNTVNKFTMPKRDVYFEMGNHNK